MQGEATSQTGTTITFWPNDEIFETVQFDWDTLRTRFQQMAFLNKGLRITITDERVATEGETIVAKEAGDEPLREEFLYEQGLVDYVEFLNSAKKTEVVHPRDHLLSSRRTPSAASRSRSRCSGRNGYSESVHTYANTINTHEGGTHEEGGSARR